jgi:DNA invertase Pin-like site-specific DNA recombinase
MWSSESALPQIRSGRGISRSPTGRFIFTLFSALAQLEREQIAQRTSDAMRFHQANGRSMSRADRCPYGTRPDPTDPDRLIEDAEEQAVIVRIRQERAKGMGQRAIAHTLDEAGIKCRGNRFHAPTVWLILRRAGSKVS